MEKSSILAVKSRHSRFFIQGEMLLFKKQSAVAILSLLSYISPLGIYGFEFNTQLNEISRKQAYQFATDILEALRYPHPLEWLAQRLDSEEYQWVSIIYSLRQSHSEISSAEKVEMVHQLYSYSYMRYRRSVRS